MAGIWDDAKPVAAPPGPVTPIPNTTYLRGTAPAGAAGMTTPGPQGQMLVPGGVWHGMHYVFPEVEQQQNITKYQQMALNVEEMDRRLAKLKQAVDIDRKRNVDRSWLDKSITGLTGDPEIAEELRNVGPWQYGKMAMHMAPGQPTQPGQKAPNARRGWIFENASALRQMAYALVHAQTQLRAYNAIKDVDKHIPSEFDSNERLMLSYEYWRAANDAAKQELAQMGIMVRQADVSPASPWQESGERFPPDEDKYPGPTPAPSATPSPSAAGAPSPSAAGAPAPPPPPGVKVKSMDTSGGFTRMEDTTGGGWYVDPTSKKWVKVGGP